MHLKLSSTSSPQHQQKQRAAQHFSNGQHGRDGEGNLSYLYCWWSLVLLVFAMNLSASFSRFREYSISISDFLRKKSCRSWRSCTLISVCCSRHFCCSMSWARISNEKSTYPLRSVKANENWVLPTKIANTSQRTSASAATPAGSGFQVLRWHTAVPALTSATTCWCPRPQHPPTRCLSH